MAGGVSAKSFGGVLPQGVIAQGPTTAGSGKSKGCGCKGSGCGAAGGCGGTQGEWPQQFMGRTLKNWEIAPTAIPTMFPPSLPLPSRPGSPGYRAQGPSQGGISRGLFLNPPIIDPITLPLPIPGIGDPCGGYESQIAADHDMITRILNFAGQNPVIDTCRASAQGRAPCDEYNREATRVAQLITQHRHDPRFLNTPAGIALTQLQTSLINAYLNCANGRLGPEDASAISHVTRRCLERARPQHQYLMDWIGSLRRRIVETERAHQRCLNDQRPPTLTPPPGWNDPMNTPHPAYCLEASETCRQNHPTSYGGCELCCASRYTGNHPCLASCLANCPHTRF